MCQTSNISLSSQQGTEILKAPSSHTKELLNQLHLIQKIAPCVNGNISPHPYNSLNERHSDVTAFMTFFSHWVTRRFQHIDIKGLNKLEKRHHIFISNHRDILLDPVLINHALLTQNFTAARSVIGSNLMEDPAMAKLMALAGCIEVPRGNMPLRKKFKALKTLSATIQTSLEDHSVWIAQREGRAKNGIDQTNPAVLKMLAMSKPKQESIKAFINKQSIVPVVISYQWDPSDIHKALEIYLNGLMNAEPSRTSRTDTMKHLIHSLDHCEGQIHINFGEPLEATDNIETLVEGIDHHITTQYKCFDSHKAASYLHQRKEIPEYLLETSKKLEQRASVLPIAARQTLFKSYANSYQPRSD